MLWDSVLLDAFKGVLDWELEKETKDEKKIKLLKKNIKLLTNMNKNNKTVHKGKKI